MALKHKRSSFIALRNIERLNSGVFLGYLEGSKGVPHFLAVYAAR